MKRNPGVDMIMAAEVSVPPKPTYEELEHQNNVLDWEVQVHKEALEKVCKEHGIDMQALLQEIANQDYSDVAE